MNSPVHISTSEAPKGKRRPWLRRVLWSLLALLVLLVVSTGVFVAWLNGDAGRRYLARRVESFINSEIRGTISIAEITMLTRRGIVARDVRFRAPGGEEVIVVRNADVEVRWSSALSGRFVSPRATVRGGRVVLHERSGTLTIDSTFQGRPRPQGEASRPAAPGPRESKVVFERIAVSDLTLVTAVPGVPDARVSDIGTVLAIDVREPGGQPLLTLESVTGSAHLDTPIAIRMRFTGGTFRFAAGDRDRVRANITAVLDDNRVRLRCTTTVRDGNPHIRVRLILPESAGPLDSLPAIAQAGLADLFSSNFDFSVDRN